MTLGWITMGYLVFTLVVIGVWASMDGDDGDE